MAKNGIKTLIIVIGLLYAFTGFGAAILGTLVLSEITENRLKIETFLHGAFGVSLIWAGIIMFSCLPKQKKTVGYLIGSLLVVTLLESSWYIYKESSYYEVVWAAAFYGIPGGATLWLLKR